MQDNVPKVINKNCHQGCYYLDGSFYLGQLDDDCQFVIQA